MSGLLVLDIDGEAGADALHDLEREHGELPATVEALTGGGGRHVYFRHPGEPIGNTAGKLGAGIDTRGDGGYVVGPPSPHPSGRRYQWSVDGHPDDVEIAPAPDWLLEALRRRKAAAAAEVGEHDPARPAKLEAHLAGGVDAESRDG